MATEVVVGHCRYCNLWRWRRQYGTNAEFFHSRRHVPY